MDILSVATSLLSGGLSGILGAVISKIADYKNKQLDIELSDKKNAHEVEMRRLDADIMSKEWAGRVSVAQTEGASQESIADAGAFAASFNEPKMYSDSSKATVTQEWLLILLDFIRGLVRPVLTIYLCILTTLIYFKAEKISGVAMSEVEAYDLVKMIINTILYLTVTAVVWWYGTRQKTLPPKL